MTRSIAALAVIAVLTSACADRADATGPPEIVYGRDLCIECGMLITEERFAAAYRTDGDERLFDDIGGMLLYGTNAAELDTSTNDAWVHDRTSGVWLAADTATYVLAPGIVTPMGYGIVAFADEHEAVAYAAAHDGEVLTWVDLFDLTIEAGRLIHDHSIHDNQNNDSTP